MPKLKLIYFDFDGGRGEAARLAMHIGGIPFEDQRVTFPQWKEMKEAMPFRAMPVLEVDGRQVAQSNSINRYVGKLAGLYPKDDLQALFADEVMDAIEDIGVKVGATIGIDAAEQKRLREELVAGPIPRYLEQINARLVAGGGEYFAEKRLTVADLKCFLWVRWYRAGVLDHIPSDIADRHGPDLVKHFERVSAHPKIAEYYASRKKD